MATLYFNNAVDTAWDTAGNWWTDVDFENAAGAIPTTGDTVYIAAELVTPPSTPVTLVHVHVADDVTGGGGFGANFTGATADATFNDSSYNTGTVTGNATFNNSSRNFTDGVVTGDADFVGEGSGNWATVEGDATFSGVGSYNDGLVEGDAEFTGLGAYSSGTVDGDAEFIYPAALSYVGTVNGATTRTGYEGETLYYKSAVSTSFEDADNWFMDEEGNYSARLSAGPWSTDDATKDMNLDRSSVSVAAEDSITHSGMIGGLFVITGTCSIGDKPNEPSFYNTFLNMGSIYNGTFSGINLSNDGFIYGGTFLEVVTLGAAGTVYGGTFAGDNIYGSGDFYGGTVSGDSFSNDGTIYGGTFSGDFFYNNSGYIYGGVFSGDSFVNNSGSIYNGVFHGDGFDNINGYIFGGIFAVEGSATIGVTYGGLWLESGKLDADSYDFNNYNAITTTTRITGVPTNPYPYDPYAGTGLHSLRILGQDVLGGGIL